MSETEIFYQAIADKFGVQRKWSDLHPAEQMQFVSATNMILGVVHD